MGRRRRADRRGHRQQLQLVRRVPRGVRARPDRGRDAVGPRPRVAARRRPLGARRDPLRAGRLAARRAHRLVSRRPHRARRRPARRGGLRAPGAARPGAAQARRRRPRRVPGHRRLRRRLGRARAARRGPAPARGRLRLRRIGAEPHGAHARPEAAVLQGGAGHAPREDPGRRVRRVHRRPVRQIRHPRRTRGSAPPSSSWPATCRTTCSASRTRRGTKSGRPDASARRSRICTRPSGASSPSSRRCSRRFWQRLTLAQRAALRAVVIEEGRELLSNDARARHRLGGASTVQAALAALVRQDLVSRDEGRYTVIDSLLREWVARQTF